MKRRPSTRLWSLTSCLSMSNTSVTWLFHLTRRMNFSSTFAMCTKWKSQKCTFFWLSFKVTKRLPPACSLSEKWSLALYWREAIVSRNSDLIPLPRFLGSWWGMLILILDWGICFASIKTLMKYSEMKFSNRAWWDLIYKMLRERGKECGSLFSEWTKSLPKENSCFIISSSS